MCGFRPNGSPELQIAGLRSMLTVERNALLVHDKSIRLNETMMYDRWFCYNRDLVRKIIGEANSLF